MKQIYDQDLALLPLNVAKFIDKLPSKNKNVGGVISSWTKIFLCNDEQGSQQSNLAIGGRSDSCASCL
jgi:hypothetical protein